jgi:hypothetical protein
MLAECQKSFATSVGCEATAADFCYMSVTMNPPTPLSIISTLAGGGVVQLFPPLRGGGIVQGLPKFHYIRRLGVLRILCFRSVITPSSGVYLSRGPSF